MFQGVGYSMTTVTYLIDLEEVLKNKIRTSNFLDWIVEISKDNFKIVAE